MTRPPSTAGPPPDAFTSLLSDLHQAADHGLDLSAADAGTSARLLGLDTLTLSAVAAAGQLELLWADPVNRLGNDLDDLQYTLGEGPSIDAARLHHTVSVADLAASPTSRWPAFQPAALRTGARAVIAVPFIFGVGPIGVLTGYRTTAGPFPDEQRRKLHQFTQVLLRLLLQTPVGQLVLRADPSKGLALHRAEVHQATGILTVQLDIPLGPALALLRAYAYSHDRPLLSVARDIVAHRLRLPRP